MDVNVDSSHMQADRDIKEYHRKRILELSLKSIKSLRDIPELEEPSFEQQEWLKGKRFHK